MLASTASFDDLVEPLHGELLRYAQNLTHSEFEANLILNEALSKAYSKFDSFEENTNFKAWIKRITFNTFISHWRKQKTNPEFVSEEDISAIDEESISVDNFDEIFSESEMPTNESIVAAYNSLSDERRQVIYCYYIKNMKYEEIASLLKIPTGTVMSRLSRAKKEIQDYIKVNKGKIQQNEEEY